MSNPQEGIETHVNYRNVYYWFRRKINGQAFNVMGEKEAALVYTRRDFRDKFLYLGWSTGAAHAAVIKASGLGRLTGEEHKAVLMADTGTLDEARTKALLAAEEAELQAALANPDKSPPRRISIETVGGSPVTTGVIADTIRMMGR